MGELTPGDTAMKVIPSSEKANAYWRVSMFKAALETLYAAPGAKEKTFDKAIEPMADELSRKWVFVAPCQFSCSEHIHVYDFFLLTDLQQMN